MIFIANILALIFNMQLTYLPFELQLKHPFTIAKFSRTSTPLMLLKIEHEGYVGYGEASMVPYMGESHQTATDFLRTVDVNQFRYPFGFGEIINYLDSFAAGRSSPGWHLHKAGRWLGNVWF